MSTAKKPVKKTNSSTLIIFGIVAILLIGVLVFQAVSGGSEKEVSAGEDLVITKSEVTETAKYYPYKIGKTNMEVLAIKASDGTIRTALNTCQVCNGSPKAYYEQDGDVLICQNCGNQFKADMVEKEKGGCNPIPIMKENKTEDDTKIVISKDFLTQAKPLFATWKTN